MNRVEHLKVTINNIPNYELRKYVVARYETQELWFYGTYDDLEKAESVAKEIGNGLVVENNDR